MRTRIKICGLTTVADACAAASLGADAIGLVFYPPSPRSVSPEWAAEIARALPPFVTVVGLFVNPVDDWVQDVLAAVPLDLLQFHGDEPEAQCTRYGRPYIKAVRVGAVLDLVEFEREFSSARALLLDAAVEGFGGGGKTFDWSLVPQSRSKPIVLAGGLEPSNVAEGIRRMRPWAVDVSSGVESAKGVKDSHKIAAFVAGVRNADE